MGGGEADELNALAASAPGQVRVLACDVTDHHSLAACAQQLATDAGGVVSLDPGWARTDLGGPAAHLSPDESVDALVAVIDQLGPEHSGGAYNRRFEPVAW